MLSPYLDHGCETHMVRDVSPVYFRWFSSWGYSLMLTWEINVTSSKRWIFLLGPQGYLSKSMFIPVPLPFLVFPSLVSAFWNNNVLCVTRAHGIVRCRIINIIVSFIFRYLVEEIKKREGFKLLLEVSDYGIVCVILSINSDEGGNFLICYISLVFVLQP